MKKSELIEQVASEINLTNNQTQRILERFLDRITDQLILGDKVELRGFGTFKLRDSKARPGRNPKTGETVQIEAHKTPIFKPAQELRNRCNS